MFCGNKNKFLRWFLSFLVLPACSNTNLMHQSAESVTTPNSINGTFCTQPPLSASTPMDVIFVIDMSFSNIGVIGPTGAYDPTPATDPTGLRFQKALDYINNCSSPGAQFAVIGFADTILNNDANNSRCMNFESASQAISDIQQLQAQQTAAQAAPVGVMKTTYYTGALECVNTLMENEIATGNQSTLKNTFFTTFFLTDGAPSDQPGNPIPTTSASQYSDQVAAIATIANQATGGFILQAVYYGNVDYTTAEQFLNPMSQAGGASGAIKIDGLADVDLCQIAHGPVRIPYQITQFAAINVTAEMKEGALLPDSDGDGIPDIQDANPLSRRTTNNILDVICSTLGNSVCANYANTACNPNAIDPQFGLSQCDQAIMGLQGVLDQDFDGIPDAVEILKGSLPLTFDADHDDGDGVTLIQKIRMGRQVYYKEGNIPTNLTMQTNFFPTQTGQCGSDSSEWSFSIANDPLVQTQAYMPTNPNEAKFIGHNAGENVILLYFYAEPINSTSMGTQIYAVEPLRVSYGSTGTVQVSPSDFKLVGEIPPNQ